MNQKEKDQIVKILKNTAEQLRETKILEIAKKKGKERLKQELAKPQLKKMLKDRKMFKAQEKKFERLNNNKRDEIEKYCRKVGLSFNRWDDKIDYSLSDTRQQLNKIVENKLNELILKVLSGGMNLEGAKIIKELTNIKF